MVISKYIYKAKYNPNQITTANYHSYPIDRGYYLGNTRLRTALLDLKLTLPSTAIEDFNIDLSGLNLRIPNKYREERQFTFTDTTSVSVSDDGTTETETTTGIFTTDLHVVFSKHPLLEWLESADFVLLSGNVISNCRVFSVSTNIATGLSYPDDTLFLTSTTDDYFPYDDTYSDTDYFNYRGLNYPNADASSFDNVQNQPTYSGYYDGEPEGTVRVNNIAYTVRSQYSASFDLVGNGNSLVWFPEFSITFNSKNSQLLSPSNSENYLAKIYRATRNNDEGIGEEWAIANDGVLNLLSVFKGLVSETIGDTKAFYFYPA